jgi:peptidoglycan biosynthesis protein MviN/MurJ (putative lipid II flippase)
MTKLTTKSDLRYQQKFTLLQEKGVMMAVLLMVFISAALLVLSQKQWRIIP